MSGDALGLSGNHAKILDLDVLPTYLREKETGLLMVWCRFGGRRKWTLPYKSTGDLAPHYFRRRGPYAVHGRTVRLTFFTQTRTDNASVKIFFSQRRTVRGPVADRPHLPCWHLARTACGPMADCPQYTIFIGFAFAEALVKKSVERRTIRLLPADCPRLIFQSAQISVHFLIIEFQIGIIAHIKFQKYQN